MVLSLSSVSLFSSPCLGCRREFLFSSCKFVWRSRSHFLLRRYERNDGRDSSHYSPCDQDLLCIPGVYRSSQGRLPRVCLYYPKGALSFTLSFFSLSLLSRAESVFSLFPGFVYLRRTRQKEQPSNAFYSNLSSRRWTGERAAPVYNLVFEMRPAPAEWFIRGADVT